MENMKESYNRATAAIDGTINKKPFVSFFDGGPVCNKTGQQYFEKMAASHIMWKEAEFYQSRINNN